MAIFEQNWEQRILQSLKVIFLDSDKREHNGSGIFVSESNMIFFVTAGHVLFNKEKESKPDNLITLRGYNNISKHEQYEYKFEFKGIIKDGLFKISDTHDVCLVLIGFYDNSGTVKFINTTEIHGDPNLKVINLRTRVETTPKIGNDLYVIGYPAIGQESNSVMEKNRPIISKGIISSIYMDKRIIIDQSHMQPGGSGGIVFDSELHIDKLEFQIRSNIIGIATQRLLMNERMMLENTNDADFELANTNIHSGFISIVPIEVVEETLTFFLNDLKLNTAYYFKIKPIIKID